MGIAKTNFFDPRLPFYDLSEEKPLDDAHARLSNFAIDSTIKTRLAKLKGTTAKLETLASKIEEVVKTLPPLGIATEKKTAKKTKLTQEWQKTCQDFNSQDLPGLEKLIENTAYNINKALRKIPLHEIHYRERDYIEEKLYPKKTELTEKFRAELSLEWGKALSIAHKTAAVLGLPLLIADRVPAAKPPARKIDCNTVLADALTASTDKIYNYVTAHPLDVAFAGAAFASAAISIYHSDLITGLAPAATLAAESLQIPLEIAKTVGSTLGSGFQNFIKSYFNAKTGAYLTAAATLYQAAGPFGKIAKHAFLGEPAPAAGGPPPVNIADETRALSKTLLIGGAVAAVPFILKPGAIANSVSNITAASIGMLATGSSSLILSQSFNPHRPSASIFFGELSKVLFTSAFVAQDIAAGNQGFITDHPALSLLGGAAQLSLLALMNRSQKLALAAGAALAGAAYQAAGKSAALGTAGVTLGLLAGTYLKTMQENGQPRHGPLIPKIFGGGIALGGLGYGIYEHFGQQAIGDAASVIASQAASHSYGIAAAAIGATALTLGAATGRITREVVRDWSATAFKGITSNTALAGFFSLAAFGGTTLGNSKVMMGAGTLLFALSATAKITNKVFSRLFR